uniref:Somatostatin receptor type 5-like n=1 Tax=Phallusia mammillata TaxID=59560 RepID=A0A6F9DT47_9ASCI|nr:somatostatin receptor type 5-like [Phallusia mammillata]
MNSTTPSTDDVTPPPDVIRNIVVPSFYIVICAIGLLGNAFVLGILIFQDQGRVQGNKRSVTNILVINLAIADFIFVGALPFWATEQFLRGRWIFGTFGCKFLSFLSLINLYGSVFFLVAMGIDRYLAVVFAVRVRNYRTPQNAIRVCIGIWLFASLIASQALAFRKVKPVNNMTRCSWYLPPGKAYLDAYFVIRTALGFFLPFLVIVYCYIFIILSLRKRSKKLMTSASHITNKQHKVTRLILCVISLFVICWLPNHIVTLMLAFNLNDEEERKRLHIDTANLISTCLAYTNSSINPIVYAFMKEDVRLQGIALIRKCCGLPDPDDHVPLAARGQPEPSVPRTNRNNTKFLKGRSQSGVEELKLPHSSPMTNATSATCLASNSPVNSSKSTGHSSNNSQDEFAEHEKTLVDTVVVSGEMQGETLL